MSVSRARSFDSVAQLYSDVRPGYPEEVYDFIAARKRFGSESRILEIGAGHGAATKEIRAYWDAEVTAIEPGENFCALLRRNADGRGKVRVVNTTFESFSEDEAYDGIFSATAFHWIDPAVKYEKAWRLLADGGLLALYWNNYSIADEILRETVDKVYRKFGLSEEGYDAEAAQRALIEKRGAELADSTWFASAGRTVIERSVHFKPRRYIDLLRTFSDHSTAEPAFMEDFYREIEEAIRKRGAEIEVRILVSVELGVKAR